MNQAQSIRTTDNLFQCRLDLVRVVGREDPDYACHGPGLAESCVRAADSGGSRMSVGSVERRMEELRWEGRTYALMTSPRMK